MKAVYVERDRLEALAKRLHRLSSGSSQELAQLKEQRQQLRQELEQRAAQRGESLRPLLLRQDSRVHHFWISQSVRMCKAKNDQRRLSGCHIYGKYPHKTWFSFVSERIASNN